MLLPSPNLTAPLLAVTLSVLAIFLPEGSRSQTLDADAEAYCSAKDVVCRKGDSLEGPPRTQDTWEAFATDEPLIRAADICLGYFLTRDQSLFSGTDFEVYRDSANIPRIVVTAVDPAFGVNFFDYPFNQFGVFQCDGSTNEFSDSIHLQEWTEYRFRSEAGWYRLDLMPNDLAQFRNDRLEVAVSIYELVPGDFNVALQADYFGPPIILE
jgi:hypothetical protein